jgi:hypothetical protein
MGLEADLRRKRSVLGDVDLPVDPVEKNKDAAGIEPVTSK